MTHPFCDCPTVVHEIGCAWVAQHIAALDEKIDASLAVVAAARALPDYTDTHDGDTEPGAPWPELDEEGFPF